jgi:fibro-slime domain-containing protein
MNLLPANRGHSSFIAHRAPGRDSRVALRHGSRVAGFTALALIGLACGAGGDTGGGLIPEGPGDGVGPSIGGSGNGGGGTPLLPGEECNGPSCELAGGGQGVTPPGCGDGTLTNDEACDDNNTTAGDGCAANCLSTEPGFSCASAGQPCVRIARCGDGLVAPTEQCDDGNIALADGCTDRCRVELGKKCDGEPSVCTDAFCGNSVQEGAEACDDGNTTPFDGCSPICLKEPNCNGLNCVSDCGDGLLINEECDDGNLVDGDGCSSTCTKETGFECVAEAACELVGGQCSLRVPAIFRDFSDTHPDFGEDVVTGGRLCTDLATGAVADTLDGNRRPTLSGDNLDQACLSTQENFADWYTSNPRNVTLVGEILLFDNQSGGYVNRFGANGEPFQGIAPNTEAGGSASLAVCQQDCQGIANNAFQCDNQCRPISDQAQQLRNGELIQLTNDLNQLNDANPLDPIAIAEVEAEIAAVEAQIATIQAQADECLDTCEANRTARAAECSATCRPCRNNPALFCRDGEVLDFDGNPLFFPVDSITGPTSNLAPARIPDQYGYNGFPFETQLYPGAPDHNFYFTTEVQYWFKYDATTQATLTFLGDDDVWVFLNGRLAVDLGGIHVPSRGSVTINGAAGTVNSTVQDLRAVVPPRPAINTASSTANFGLVDGNVYMITIFNAERKRDGSSFQLTLAGFEATPSECTAICGDGVLSFGEECDDGTNDGGYGECGADCRLGPFCGDAIQQPEFGEDCDVGPGGDGACRGCRILDIR